MVSCYSQTWNSDVWWLPPVTASDVVIYPEEIVQKRGYESFVFISAQGVTDLKNDLNSSFSMAAVHGEMMQAGAHVAMAAASYDAIESGEFVNEPDDRRCVGKGGGIGVPAPASGDSPIMVLTLPAWRCLVDRMLVHKLGERDPSSGVCVCLDIPRAWHAPRAACSVSATWASRAFSWTILAVNK
jgi:hypothetical protein